MSRARSAVAVRTTVDKLREAAVEAFNVEVETEVKKFDDFYDAVEFCRPRTELLGGEARSDAWYFWKHGDWAVMGDLGVDLQNNDKELCRLSEKLGNVVVAALDVMYEYAYFASYEDGELRRRLLLEEGAFGEEGLPVKPERGRRLLDFNEQECERIWTAFKLPTFEHDPLNGPFYAIGVKKPEPA